MSLSYDREKLEKILGDFCILTGLSVSVLDVHSTVIATCNDKPPCLRVPTSRSNLFGRLRTS